MYDYVNRIADIIHEYGADVEQSMQENMALWVSRMDTHTEGAQRNDKRRDLQHDL